MGVKVGVNFHGSSNDRENNLDLPQKEMQVHEFRSSVVPAMMEGV